MTHRNVWLSWGVIFEGLGDVGVQKTPRHPAGWDYALLISTANHYHPPFSVHSGRAGHRVSGSSCTGSGFHHNTASSLLLGEINRNSHTVWFTMTVCCVSVYCDDSSTTNYYSTWWWGTRSRSLDQLLIGWGMDMDSIVDLPGFQCWGYFHPKHKETKIFENHVNHVVLVFIG